MGFHQWKWGSPTTGRAICNWIQATALLCRRYRSRGAGGEEDYDFEFAELVVEVGGDFDDAFEGLESLVFDVDYAEADCLELAQDVGDLAGFRHTGANGGRGGR